MQRAWFSGTSTLAALFEAAQGSAVAERSCLDRRTGSFRDGWSDILTRLSPVEAAMLQDFTWWGPQMQRRLGQLTDVQATT